MVIKRVILSIKLKDNQLNQEIVVLLFIVPFIFIIYSLFTGNIQIYPFAPISYLNLRYGVTITIAMSIYPLIFFTQGSYKRKVSLLLIVIVQYILMLSGGVRSLAVIAEPFRNNFNNRETIAQNYLAEYLKNYHWRGKVMLFPGELMPIINKSNLTFKDILFANHATLGEKVPDTVNTIILKEGDELWQELSRQEQFSQAFSLVYTVEPSPKLMVYRRFKQQGSGIRE